MNTIVDLINQRSSTNPTHPVFHWLPDGMTVAQTLNYAALAAHARTVAAWLQQHNTGGAPVLLLCPNGPEFIAAFFGCLFAGVVAVPLPASGSRRRLPQLHALAQHVQANLVLTTATTHAALAEQLAPYPALQSARWQAVEQLDPALAQTWQPPAITGSTTTHLQFTSGSTALPKGVVISHGQLLDNVAQMCQRYALGPHDRGLFWLPFYHDMGLISGLLAPIYVEGQALLMPPEIFAAQPLRWLEAMSHYRATISAAPPSAYRHCLEQHSAAERQTLDLGAWRVAIWGAEAIHASTLSAFAATFAAQGFRATALCPSYGLAEATLLVTAHDAQQPPRTLMVDAQALTQGRVREVANAGQELISCGPPVTDCSVAIVASEGQIRLADDAVGEIWVRGPQVATGYWNAPEATQATFDATLADSGEGGFLRTGDLGFLHEGELFIVGRKKDLLIVNGANYAPEDLEQVVMDAHAEAIAGVAAFALSSGEAEQIVLLLERRRTWRPASAPEARQQLATSAQRSIANAMGLWVVAVGLVAPSQLPRTTSGKLQRFRCRERLLAAATAGVELFTYPQPAPIPLPQQSASNFILTFLAQRCQVAVAELNQQQRLSALGIGSLDVALLRAQLAEQHGVTVPIAWLVDDPTLEEFLARVGGVG